MRARSLELRNIKIKDPFWSGRVDLVRNAIIPYQWKAMNDLIPDAESSHCLDNFEIAAGRKEGKFYGAVFQDTDVAKWLEAVGFTLECYPDAKLERTADEVIDLIAEAQQPDGYINTYFTIKAPERRWSDLCEGHELYTAGHLMEAAVAYYYGTGKKKFLECMCRFADLICDTFGFEEGKIHGYPGHQEVEIGLIKLYHATGKRRYLDQAKYFIDARGVGDNYFLEERKKTGYEWIFPDFENYDTKYSQSHLPVREQTTAEGHAVRATYMYCAMADLAYEYQDAKLMQACERIWNNIVEKRMYITGGIGSSGFFERFTTDYDLPNGYAYAESCASIGLALFGMRMAQITKKAAYIDVVERALYNTVLAGIALDGKSFFYVNPLEVWPPSCMDRTSKEHVKPIRQKWFGVACCPPNIARTLASLGQYIYSWDEEERTLYVNLFVSGETKVETKNGDLLIRTETKFPWEMDMHLDVENHSDEPVKIMCRIPDYAKEYQIWNSQAEGRVQVTYEEKEGYAEVTIEEKMQLDIRFEADAGFVRANPEVREDAGKVAIVRGPLVYCLEEADNGENLSMISVDTEQALACEESDICGGCIVVKAKGKRLCAEQWTEGLYGKQKLMKKDVGLTAVPYYCWNNRGMGEMEVWIREE